MFSFQGITVNLDENNDLTIARILQGSLADKQGLYSLVIFAHGIMLNWLVEMRKTFITTCLFFFPSSFYVLPCIDVSLKYHLLISKMLVTFKKRGYVVYCALWVKILFTMTGLLRTGDKVREVNGTEVFTPEDMMILLKEASASVTMKVVPSYNSSAPTDEVCTSKCLCVCAHILLNVCVSLCLLVCELSLTKNICVGWPLFRSKE